MNDSRMPVRGESHVIPALFLFTTAQDHWECSEKYRYGESLGFGCDTIGISDNMGNHYVRVNPDTQFLELGDVILVLLPFGWIALASLGDLMIVIGYAVFAITCFLR